MSDGAIAEVVEKIRPVPSKTADLTVKPVVKLISGFHYDPNPTKTKIKLGTKWAIPSMIMGMIIAIRFKHKDAS